MLTQVVNGHESRLQAVESAGTVAARSHIDKDDDRDREMARQIQELRVTLGTITDLKVELKVMNTTLNNLLSAFDEHRKMKN